MRVSRPAAPRERRRSPRDPPAARRNLAAHQTAAVDLRITRLPVLRHADAVDAAVGNLFGLLEGRSAETSGGLLVILPAAAADAFVADISELDGQPAWVVGEVVEMQMARPDDAPLLFYAGGYHRLGASL